LAFSSMATPVLGRSVLRGVSALGRSGTALHWRFGSSVTPLALGLPKAWPLLALRRSNVLPLRPLATLLFYHLVTPDIWFSSA